MSELEFLGGDTFGKNRANPRLPVKHAALERWGGSPYKSVCPVCGDGLLLVARDQGSLRLEENDRCTHCLQPFYYLDIVAMRGREEGRG